MNTVLEECYVKEYVGSPQYNLILLEERHEDGSTQFLEAFASGRLGRRQDAHLCS